MLSWPPLYRGCVHIGKASFEHSLHVLILRRRQLTMPEARAGGDAFFTICLWRSGFALTDPGFSVFNPDAKLFDPFQYEVCLPCLQCT